MLDVERLKTMPEKIVYPAMRAGALAGAKILQQAIRNAANFRSDKERAGDWAHTQDVIVIYKRKSKDSRDIGPWTGYLIGAAKRNRRERAPQAYWREHGHKGGTVIKPVKAKILHWIDKKSGKHVFRKRVVQGAQQPRPWLNPAFDRAQQQAVKTAMDTIQKAVSEALNG